jgi:hypothetical protein
MTPAQFEARWRHDLAHAEATLRKDGFVSPLFVVRGADGTERVIPASFASAEEKALAYDLVRLMAVACDAELVMCRAESWLVLGQLPEGIAPSQSDRRIEVVSLTMSARVGKRVVNRSSLREIMRDVDGKPSGLAEVGLPNGKLDMAGPMFELLPPVRPDAGQRAMAAALVQVMQERAGTR